jgi:hypothetical protein
MAEGLNTLIGNVPAYHDAEFDGSEPLAVSWTPD